MPPSFRGSDSQCGTLEYQKFDKPLLLKVFCSVKCLQIEQKQIPTDTFFSCNQDSSQPLTVHCCWLYSVQPDDIGKRNTAKSCTEYS